MTIPKDTKDWTWVLERPCPQCGFDATAIRRTDVARIVHENAAAWRPLLAHPFASQRPSRQSWSALEYACHVRDVFRIYDGRLSRMLSEDDPLYANWDQDVTAVEDRYAEQHVEQVADELEAAGENLAGRFEQVAGEAWERTGRRSDGASFTVDSFARYLIHDPEHHLHDVARGFAALGG